MMSDKCTSPEGHRTKVQPRPWTLEREGYYATIHDANGQIVGPLVDLGLGWTDTSTGNYSDPHADADVLAFIVEVVNEHTSLTEKVERLENWQGYVFRIHPNIDLDIERLKPHIDALLESE